MPLYNAFSESAKKRRKPHMYVSQYVERFTAAVRKNVRGESEPITSRKLLLSQCWTIPRRLDSLRWNLTNEQSSVFCRWGYRFGWVIEVQWFWSAGPFGAVWFELGDFQRMWLHSKELLRKYLENLLDCDSTVESQLFRCVDNSRAEFFTTSAAAFSLQNCQKTWSTRIVQKDSLSSLQSLFSSSVVLQFSFFMCRWFSVT